MTLDLLIGVRCFPMELQDVLEQVTMDSSEMELPHPPTGFPEWSLFPDSQMLPKFTPQVLVILPTME